MGLRRPDRGRVLLEGSDITDLGVSERLSLGLGYIPSDRMRLGMVEGLSVARNLILGRQRDGEFSNNGFLRTVEVRRYASRLISDFRIEPGDPGIPIESLSGGNQQKVVVARELSKKPKILIACNPTRGLDISATSQIHGLIFGYASSGGSVLLVSADLSEVLTLSNRIGVMYRGRMVGIIDAENADEETLGFMMMGVKK